MNEYMNRGFKVKKLLAAAFLGMFVTVAGGGISSASAADQTSTSTKGLMKQVKK